MADYTNLEKLYKALGRHRDMFYLLLRKANKSVQSFLIKEFEIFSDQLL